MPILLYASQKMIHLEHQLDPANS